MEFLALCVFEGSKEAENPPFPSDYISEDFCGFSRELVLPDGLVESHFRTEPQEAGVLSPNGWTNIEPQILGNINQCEHSLKTSPQH